jgi:hypothetical protein
MGQTQRSAVFYTIYGCDANGKTAQIKQKRCNQNRPDRKTGIVFRNLTCQEITLPILCAENCTSAGKRTKNCTIFQKLRRNFCTVSVLRGLYKSDER